MKTFSVIIPTYNRREYLLACLASVSAQRHCPDEVIVVDDGSTDGTVEALAGIEGVTVIQQENAGPGAARNRGAAAAKGDYLVFLDSDDLWFEWTLEVFVELIVRHEDPSMLFARFADFADMGELGSIVASGAPSSMAYDCYLASARHGYFAGAGMMVIAQTAFERVGGFIDDRLNAEDHDLALRLGDAPGFVQVVAPVTIAHRIHSDNAMGDLEKTIRGVARLIEKERSGQYPGGGTRQEARRTVITSHVRPVVLQAIQAGNLRAAWQLYRCTLSWNARAGRASFLIAGPLLMLRAALLALVGQRNARSTR